LVMAEFPPSAKYIRAHPPLSRLESRYVRNPDQCAAAAAMRSARGRLIATARAPLLNRRSGSRRRKSVMTFRRHALTSGPTSPSHRASPIHRPNPIHGASPTRVQGPTRQDDANPNHGASPIHVESPIHAESPTRGESPNLYATRRRRA
jgi:hypothetical protein